MASTGQRAEKARVQFRQLLERPGHAVDNTREAMATLESALAEGVLMWTPEIDQTLADLRIALEQDDGQKLGGKSAEAARFITKRLSQLLDDA